ncbi:MAG: glycosyltransferase family 2 protein [Anaerolineae bacterium]|nr:glycosyltransferase family 2 protein [Anaerolineae bacterium]
MPRSEQPDTPPLVSVVLPVYNEAVFIRRALSAVLAQDYPANRLEVLVVDGCSTDQTVSIVQAIVADDPRVRLLSNPGRIQAHAMNIALDAAQGDVIIRVDGHAIIAPDYVSRCVYHLEATGADNVGGPQRFVGITPMGKAIAAAYRSPFGVPSRFTVSQQAEYVDTVYLGAWPRTVFERVGRFDNSLAVNEDYEFNYRIRKAGGRIYLSPDIRSEYYGRQMFGALWRQFFRYGGWKLNVLAKHPASTQLRHLVAPAFVAALVGGALLAPFSPWIARLWALTLIAYGLAAGAASIWQAARDGWDLLPRLPLVFAGIHLAWGSGFWFQAIRRLVSQKRKKPRHEIT